MLPTNYTKCQQRTRSMVRRLAATPELLHTYGNIIAEHEARGFIERVADPQPTDNAHYIPHHPVKKDSTTTPIRIVYDCSFHSSPDNPSLNDCLLVGPPFLNNMCSILLRFRTFTYGLSTDIEKAFLHVGLDDSDRDKPQGSRKQVPSLPLQNCSVWLCQLSVHVECNTSPPPEPLQHTGS